ncbi:proteasome subunit alpha [Serinibacter salmoneus]|uniref:Proteasome subunit alpha n=1 Tax=Serinibacter salmoneus TaxID=556530 RepID=A0A2A9D1P5_9MICO|nr:proteasome subunit alpha [Serinibacter salmoneus]PFG19770.1 proteasome alpha subunit [Serinibacter salmoneus]
MSMPFYVAPEQFMQDRADFARQGIARGRSVVVMSYAGGILFATHNPSRALHKVSEIYDRIAFAAVGKYHEFESLRVAGIRYADLRGYTYDRADVNVRGLATSYARTLATVFTQEAKPFEVELVVAEVAQDVAHDQIYRLSFDGSLTETPGYVVIGGDAEQRTDHLASSWSPDAALPAALRGALAALAVGADHDTPPTGELEVAVLGRSGPRRAFRRLAEADLAGALDPAGGEQP